MHTVPNHFRDSFSVGRSLIILIQILLLGTLTACSAAAPEAPQPRPVPTAPQPVVVDRMIKITSTIGESFSCDLHYCLAGNGPQDVILIHGNPGSVEDFRQLLENPPAGYRFLAIDLPGYGKSQRLPESDTVWLRPESHADVLRVTVEDAGLKRPIVMAHSWGSLVAVSYSGRTQGKESADLAPAALCLLNPVAFPDPKCAPVGTGFLAQIQPLRAGSDNIDDGLRIDGPIVWNEDREYTVGPLRITVGKGSTVKNRAQIQGTLSDLISRLSREDLERSFAPFPVAEEYRAWITKSVKSITFVRSLARDSLAITDGPLKKLAETYKTISIPVVIYSGHGDQLVQRSIHAEPMSAEITGAVLVKTETIPENERGDPRPVPHMITYTHPKLVVRALQDTTAEIKRRQR